MTRERAHAQLQIEQLVELLGQMAAQHADQAGRQSALRHQHRARLRRHVLYGAHGRHILGQIEVMHALPRRSPGHALGTEERQGIDDQRVLLQRAGQRRIVVDVQLQRADLRVAAGRGLHIGQRDGGFMQLGSHVGDR
jgi:hypothetical protein